MNEISLASLLRLCWRNAKWLVLGLLIGAIAMFSISTFAMTPTYQSSADLFVTSLTYFEDGNITSSALAASQALTYSYAEVLNNNVVLEQVADEVNESHGTNLTASGIKSTLNFTIPEDTNILRVTCVHTKPAVAEAICNALYGMAPSVLEETCGVGTSKQVGPATKATLAGPNTTLNTMLGAVIGLVLVVAVVLIRWMTDNTVKGKEDLAEHSDVPVLAEIPAFEDTRRKEKTKRVGKVKMVRSSMLEKKEGN